jgi:hypothetical protein
LLPRVAGRRAVSQVVREIHMDGALVKPRGTPPGALVGSYV